MGSGGNEPISTIYHTPVTIDKTSKILDQMKKSICKIKTKNGRGTGFFCTAELKSKEAQLLITSHHIVDKKILDSDGSLDIIIDNDEEKTIEINEKRKVYINKEYDLTIIELREKDKIKDFLELDNIFDNDYNLSNQSIYLLQYSKLGKDQKAAVSYGMLKEIEGYDMVNYCNALTGSIGGPILNLQNNKVIGMHREASSEGINKATFLKFALEEFFNNENIEKIEISEEQSEKKVKKDKKGKKEKDEDDENEETIISSGGNEINLELKIEKDDLNKEVYFLDNTDIFDENLVKHFHDYLKELNDSNVELFIDEKKIKYQKFYTFEKTGTYSVKLKFKQRIKDCSYMFCNCVNIINIDLSSFDSKSVNNMTRMFYNCEKLAEIKFGNFRTNKVTNMYSLFEECKSLTNLDLSSFDTGKVTSISRIFYGCKKLKTIDMSSFDDDNMDDFKDMLYDCDSLSKVKITQNLFDRIKKTVDGNKIEFVLL